MNAIAQQSFWDTADTEPYPFYDRMRGKGDVVWDPTMRAWLVLSAAAAREVLQDDALFQHPVLTMQAGSTYLAIRGNNPRSFFFLQGEKHRQMHRWWVRDLLSLRWVDHYKPTAVEPAVKALLDGLAGRTSFDAIDEFAELLPLGVFARLLDLPQDNAFLLHIKQLNDDIAAFASLAHSLKLETNASAEDKAVADQAVAAALELDRVLLPIVEARRAGTGEDLVSRLWAGGPQIFEDWNTIDTLDGCRRLLFAGIDTTTHAAANAFHALLTDRALMQTVRSGGQATVERFVEEVLRLNGSVQFRPRRVTADATVAGVPVRQGDMLIVMLMAANRDPLQFGCPHELDLKRSGARAHLSFLTGSRTCPGAALARAELVAAVRALLDRYPDIALDVEAEPPSFRGFMFRSYRPLNVRVGAGRYDA